MFEGSLMLEDVSSMGWRVCKTVQPLQFLMVQRRLQKSVEIFFLFPLSLSLSHTLFAKECWDAAHWQWVADFKPF